MSEVSAVGDSSYSIIPLIIALTCISLQIKEFRKLGFYINDSVFGRTLFSAQGYISFALSLGLFAHVKYYASPRS